MLLLDGAHQDVACVRVVDQRDRIRADECCIFQTAIVEIGSNPYTIIHYPERNMLQYSV